MRLRRPVVICLSIAISSALLQPLPNPPTAAAANGWLPGPGARLENSYTGTIDEPPAGVLLARGRPIRVSGWAVDTTAQGWAGFDDVHIYDGVVGSGTMLASAMFGQPRPDVGEVLGNAQWVASGFSALIETRRYGDGPRTLTVYAHTPSKGWWARQVTFSFTSDGGVAMPVPMERRLGGNGARPTVVITAPKFGATMQPGVSTESTYLITGYAFDPQSPPHSGVQGSGVSRVEIWLNGSFEGTAELGYSDAQAAVHGIRFQNSGYRYAIRQAGLRAGNNQLEVRAQSAAGAMESYVQTTFSSVPHPNRQ